MSKGVRKTGIDAIGDVAWGTHICLFYQTKEDLLDILVAYFKAGLEENEFCMWVTSEPLEADDAKNWLGKMIDDLDDYIAKGQMEILDYTEWYTESGTFDADEVLQNWVAKENEALQMGFDGLRATANTFWLEQKNWKTFNDYERMIDDFIGEHRMIAICTYSLDKCGASEIMDVVSTHRFALVKREGGWEIVESAERKQGEEALRESEERYRDLYEEAPIAYFSIGVDGRIKGANRAAEDLLGYTLHELVGRPVFELYADTPAGKVKAQEVFCRFRAGADVHEEELEMCRADGSQVWISLSVRPIRDTQGRVVESRSMVLDITEQKEAEETLREYARALGERVKELDCLYAISNLVQEPDINLEKILQGVADLMPPAWQYPEITCARLILKGREFKTENFEESIWKQTSDIAAQGEQVGTLQVYYLEERPESDEGPFLKEERLLIDAIAQRVGRITERKKAEQELRQHRNRLEELVEQRTAELRTVNELLERIFATTHLLIAYMDTDFNFIRVNRAYAAADGREPDFFVGKNHFDLYPHEENESIFCKVVETGQPYTAYAKPFEYSEHPERGLTHWDWTLHPVGDTSGRVEGLILVLVDVTERIRAQETLHESEENFRALAENASDGIVIVTGEAGIAYANRRAGEITGYTVAEILEMNVKDVMHPDELHKVTERLQKRLAGERVPRQYETAIVAKSGGKVPVEVAAARTVWHGQPADIVVVRDITERRETQAALIQSEKLSITGKLAASLAHEINNPLQTVIGCLGLAEETLAAGGEVGQYLQIGREELQRAARIVAQLRDLQRRSEPEAREPTDVNTLLERVLTLSRKRCEERGVEVVWEAATDLPPLMLVRDRMQQVFLNLILNAVDAMPEGGQLQVSATQCSDPEEVRVSFVDNGMGIAPEVLPHIFDPFYSTKSEGLGLGLFVSQNIVEEHGGHIEVESRLGEGTIFTVWLLA